MAKTDKLLLQKKNKVAPEKGLGIDNNFHKEKSKKQHSGNMIESGQKEKKPFDKKAYRFKKYSKKYKLDKWEDERRKRLLSNYYKEIKKDPDVGTYKPVSFDEYENDPDVGLYVRHPDMLESNKQQTSHPVSKDLNPRKSAHLKIKELKERQKAEKLKKQEEILLKKKEKEQKLLEYKKNKAGRFKKLSKKTKRGQPVMSGRLELLLEKIKKENS